MPGIFIYIVNKGMKARLSAFIPEFYIIESYLQKKLHTLYNGDIFTYDDFMHISSRFPSIKNFMLGRGALEDPFLPAAIKGQSIPSGNKIDVVKHFHDEIFNYYKNILSGEKHLCDKMKEFWVYMSVHINNSGKLMKKIKKCHTEAGYLEAVNQILCSSAVWNDSALR